MLTSLKATVNAPTRHWQREPTTNPPAPPPRTWKPSKPRRWFGCATACTVVLGGLIQTEVAKNLTKVPLLGDIPILGKLFTGTYDSKQKEELVIFVTPHIVREDEVSAKLPKAEGARDLRMVEPH